MAGVNSDGWDAMNMQGAPALSDNAGQGWGLRQVGKGTLHWPWGSGGEVQNQGQEVGVGMAEGWGKRRE